MSHPPFHQKQIARTLPAWAKALHHKHASRIVRSLNREYLNADGVAYNWYDTADTPNRQALHNAIAVRDSSRAALHRALASLQGISEFCTPLLQARLALDIPVGQAQYVYQAVEIEKPKTPPAGPPVSREPGQVVAKGKPQLRSLLEAALHNFEGPGDRTRFSRLQRSAHDIRSPAGLTLAQFIGHCRELDLGQRYQEHLADVFDGANKDQLATLAIQARRDEFRVQTRVAACKGLLSSAASVALHELCAGNAAPAYQGRALRCSQLLLLNIPIHEVLFIAPEQNGKHDPVFLYNPVDEDQLRAFESLGHVHQYLREQLLDTDYRNRFVAFALQQQQPELDLRLKQVLFGKQHDDAQAPPAPSTSIHLESIFRALPTQPWASLESDHRVRLKADARKVAVPTADVDAKVRLRHLEYWFDVGMTVLNVAAMLVPALNPLMLTLGAAQIAGSVFHGIESWEAGDNAQALAQLESVLLNVAVLGAVGAGAAVLKSSGFVDGMLSIVKEGKEYLWDATLQGYASRQSLPEQLEPDSQGRYSLNGQQYISLDDTLYQVVQKDGRWRVAHPDDPDAYQPALVDNAAGAWRAAHEQPLEWDDQQLMRRLGLVSASLDEADLEAALQCSGVKADELRYTHAAAQQPPALLADMLDRLRSDRQADDLIDRVRNAKPMAAYRNFALPALLEVQGWPEQHVIKAYTGPESWGDFVRYGKADEAYPVQIEINRSELEAGQLSSRVLEQLDEQAVRALLPADTRVAERATALSGKLAQYLEGSRQQLFERLHSSGQPVLDDAARPLANQFTGLSRRAINHIMARVTSEERLRLASGRVPLRVAEEARAMQAHTRLNKALLGLYRPALATEDTKVLQAALKVKHPGSTDAQLFDIAMADRAQAARLIGQQPIRPGYRSPMRLADGRLGYPLSGRLRRLFDTPRRRLRALYPSLDDVQINVILRQLRAQADVGEQITALEHQRDALDNALHEWQGLGDQQASRTTARELINGAWRRDNPDILTLDALDIGALPSLPARFDHIIAIQIRNIGLTHVPLDFFQSFPSLRILRVVQSPALDFDGFFEALQFAPQLEILELGNNRLGNLSSAMRQRLGGLTHLRQLSLRTNQLQLTEADLQTLAQLPLERLDLEYNQISLDANGAAHFANMHRLQDLRLTANPLALPPDLTGLVRLGNLQLRNCALRTWPRGLTELMAQDNAQLQHLSLSYNPISQVADLEQVLASPYVNNLRNGRSRGFWDFNENAMDAPSNRRLRAAGVEIETDSDLSEAGENLWLERATDGQRQSWDSLFATGDYPYLREVIERAGRSAQARDNPRGMATQVWRLLDQAAADQALREHLDTIAQAYPPTCGDAGADAFSAIETEALAYAELANTDNPAPGLFNFYRRLYRREMVNELAARIQLARRARQERLLQQEREPVADAQEAPALPPLDPLDDITDEQLLQGGVDLIEIRLALRQALAPPLDYPEPSQGMLYRQEARVNASVEFNVEQAVESLDNSATAHQEWIAAQPSWQRMLQERFADEFAALDERWYQGIQYLDYCLEPSSEAVTSLDGVVLQAISEAIPGHSLSEAGQLRRVELDSQQFDTISRSLSAGRERQRLALIARLTQALDASN